MYDFKLRWVIHCDKERPSCGVVEMSKLVQFVEKGEESGVTLQAMAACIDSV